MSIPKFPPAPLLNQTFVSNSVTWLDGKSRVTQQHWKWNGRGWEKIKNIQGDRCNVNRRK